MKFGKRLMGVEATQIFFDLCEEDELCYSQMKERLEEIRKNKNDIDGVNHYSISRMQEELYNLDSCPRCDGEFFYDDQNEERYCPKCYQE